MNTYPCTAVIVFWLTSAAAAHAASKVDVTVTGRLTPDACLVTLSDEGVIDHGKILSHTLSDDVVTELPSRVLQLHVHCGRPMLFALVGLDNRAQSSLDPDVLYGLGRNIHAPAERLGSVALSYRNPVGDAQVLQVLASDDSGETWRPASEAWPKTYIGFAPVGDRQPDFIGQLSAQLQIDTSINATQYLTLDQAVPLDGSVVLDLRYL